jgi:peptidyl-prolyl cis-trans isomerase A (cyclophilin A)
MSRGYCTTRERPIQLSGMLAAAALLLQAARASSEAACACLGGAGYGNTCASWDAADETPWCRVGGGAAACGADDTFESDEGHFWAHSVCGGEGRPYDASAVRGGAAAAALAARYPGGVSGAGHPVVVCATSLGPYAMELRADWSPRGAQRVLELVRKGFFTDIGFFRVNKWITQYGADRKSRRGAFSSIRDVSIKDDPNPFEGKGWARGMVAMPGGGPNTRASQLLVVRAPNSWNGGPGQPNGGAMGAEFFDAPVGRIIAGMDTVFDKLYEGYGDVIEDSANVSPDQGKIFEEGNAYLHREFPKLDWLRSCTAPPGAKLKLTA